MININFEQFLVDISPNSLKVIDEEISTNEYFLIDLSEKNKDLEMFDISSSQEWEKYIDAFLKEKNAKVAFGGYLEKRNIYNRSTYFSNQDIENQRNIHLGIDLWCKAGTKVLAVLDGEIHSFKFNENYGDYGPTIILKHVIKNVEFYSLYGHLSMSSIKNLKIGTKIYQGEIIGFLGDASINGDYAPHLHFQIIKDLNNNFGDYPGVSSEKTLNFYKKNCPNPNLLLKLKMPVKTD